MKRYLKIGTYEQVMSAYNSGKLGDPFVGYDPEENSVYASYWDLLEYNYRLGKESYSFPSKIAGSLEYVELGYTVYHNDYVFAGTNLIVYNQNEDIPIYAINGKGDLVEFMEYTFEQDASTFSLVFEEVDLGKEIIKAFVLHPEFVENNKEDDR